jgi:hypothetical protein
MSPEHHHIPEPGEQVYLPAPSWAPLVFSFAVALALCSIFISFMLPNWAYAIGGLLIALFALRSMAKDATRNYFRLPRKQRVRGAVLPVEKISPPQA